MTSLQLFNQIRQKLTDRLKRDNNLITYLKTVNGNTQSSERKSIQVVKDCLDELGISYELATSQLPNDFKNVGGLDFQIEIKKTDGFSIKFNDTCPCEKTFYIVFFTGKLYTRKEDISGQCLFLTSKDFLEDSEEWILKYIEGLNKLRNEFCRGDNARDLPGGMSVYARPSFTFKNIRNMLGGSKSSIYSDLDK